jgi:hypothetical protein
MFTCFFYDSKPSVPCISSVSSAESDFQIQKNFIEEQWISSLADC